MEPFPTKENYDINRLTNLVNVWDSNAEGYSRHCTLMGIVEFLERTKMWQRPMTVTDTSISRSIVSLESVAGEILKNNMDGSSRDGLQELFGVPG